MKSVLRLSLIATSVAISTLAQAQNRDPLAMWKSGGRVVAASQPEYPPEALANGVQGKLTVEFGMNHFGHPRGFRIIEGAPNGVFDEATTSALAKWRLLPKYSSPCDASRTRMRLDFWFEISDGKPKVSVSKILDAPTDMTLRTVDDPPAILSRPDIDNSTDLPRQQILVKRPHTRVKEGTFRFPTYPWAARQKGLVGLVVAEVHYRADGRVESIGFPYFSPSDAFRDAVFKSLWETELETTEGKSPGVAVSVCRPFIMYPDK